MGSKSYYVGYYVNATEILILLVLFDLFLIHIILILTA